MNERAASVAVALAAAALSRPALAWEYFEHRYLADVACAEREEGGAKPGGEEAGVPCMQVEVAGQPARAVTFGDLVAMAGDHFGEPEDLGKALAAYRRALDAQAEGKRGPPPESTDVGRILQVREFQLAGVRAWMAASPARIAAASKHRVAWLDLDGWEPAPGAAVDAAQERLLRSEASRTEREVPAATLTPAERKELARLRDSVRQTREYLEGERGRRPPLLAAVPDPPEWTARFGAEQLPPLRGDCYSAGPDEEALFAQLDGYVALAARNGTHFGARTVVESERYAEEARRMRDPAGRCGEGCAVRLAFALHHWTDRFSAGHMRTPRTRLANMEARRRHDFDDVNGLVVFQGNDPQPRLWRAFGDACLLGATAGPGRERTIEGARGLLRVVGGASDRVAYPEVARQNPAVPRSPRYVDVRVEAGFGGAWAGGASHRASFAARWELDVHLRGWWVPPPLTQAILAGPRVDALVPLAVEPIELGLQLADLLRECDPDAAPQQREVCWRKATSSWARIRDFSLQPAVGWALARTTGSGSLRSSLYAALSARYELYDGLFLGAAGEALPGRSWSLTWSVNAALRVR